MLFLKRLPVRFFSENLIITPQVVISARTPMSFPSFRNELSSNSSATWLLKCACWINDLQWRICSVSIFWLLFSTCLPLPILPIMFGKRTFKPASESRWQGRWSESERSSFEPAENEDGRSNSPEHLSTTSDGCPSDGLVSSKASKSISPSMAATAVQTLSWLEQKNHSICNPRVQNAKWVKRI